MSLPLVGTGKLNSQQPAQYARVTRYLLAACTPVKQFVASLIFYANEQNTFYISIIVCLIEGRPLYGVKLGQPQF